MKYIYYTYASVLTCKYWANIKASVSIPMNFYVSHDNNTSILYSCTKFTSETCAHGFSFPFSVIYRISLRCWNALSAKLRTLSVTPCKISFFVYPLISTHSAAHLKFSNQIFHILNLQFDIYRPSITKTNSDDALTHLMTSWFFWFIGNRGIILYFMSNMIKQQKSVKI